MITTKVLPLIDKVCARMLGGLTPKDKVTLAQFRQTMSQINESILEKLFAQVGDEDESDTREG